MPRKRRNNAACNHDLFTDYCLTKSELTELLGISRDSVLRWSKLAFYHIKPYRDAFPQLSDGSYDTEAPLNPYQCWVLARLGREFRKLRTADRVKRGIALNPAIYSPYTYRKALQNLDKLNTVAA
jgi:hypothetical protein